jgi:putative transposase
VKKRRATDQVQECMNVSERRVCRVIGQPRSTQRQEKKLRKDEPLLREQIVHLALQYGRYGYRRITALLRNDGWRVNHKRVERIWQEEGLKVPRKQRKRRRLWLNDGSCIRLRPEYTKHVWSYDFLLERTSDGKPMRILNIIDEYSRECLAIGVDRRLNCNDVIERLAELFVERGTPDFIRSDNGSEFTADLIRGWLGRLGVHTLFIEPGSPWENGYIESFNGKMRDELLNGEIFDTILEARVITEQWRKEYNQKRPHSSLNYRPPAPEAILPIQIQLDLNQELTIIPIGT